MRQIVYFNRKPAYYLNRSFKLSCSELNGRFSSNDYIQTLTVIHPNSRLDHDGSRSSLTESTSASPVEHLPSPAHASAQLHDHAIPFKDSRIRRLSEESILRSNLGSSDAFSRPSARKSLAENPDPE